MQRVKQFFTVIVFLLVGIEFVMFSWVNLLGDVFYNEDIARDLLLLEDLVTKRSITLIGSRISVIGGLFHGPLWLYLNLPAYLLGHGSPLVMGIFWLLLYLGLLIITYYVAKKLFNSYVALFSILLLTSTSYSYVFTNTYGALLVFPLYFYFFNLYLKTLKLKNLFMTFFLCGLLIQFEVAFGGPILILSILYLLVYLYKKKRIYHLASLAIIFLPLSTYLLFDLRHGFLQIHSIINYFTAHSHSFPKLPLASFIFQHFGMIFNKSLEMMTYGSFYLNILIVGVFFYVLLVAKKKDKLHYSILKSFLFLYVGFWIISLIYREGMWPWYYNEFITVLVIIFCSSLRFLNKYVFIILFLLLYFPGINKKISQFATDKTFKDKSEYSWQLYNTMAQAVYGDAPKEFGYYLNEHDLLGYRTRYALHYAGRRYVNKGFENVKKRTTYLVMGNELDNLWWKKERVHFIKDPVQKLNLNRLYTIEKYQLDEKEISVPSDPNLINSSFFR